jgi:hypothetical protein
MSDAVKVATDAVSQVKVEDYHVNPNTGHITLSLTTYTKTGNASWQGETKQYGCSLQMLRDQFNGDIDQLESHFAAQHKSITGPPPGLVEALMKRKGRVLA